MTTIYRLIAVLRLSSVILALIQQCRNIVAAMTNNKSFPKPLPGLDTITAYLDALASAQTTAKTRVAGSIEARDAAKRVVLTAMHQLKAYVQSVADADPVNAETIITSAGMGVRNVAVRQRQVFDAWMGELSGEVMLCAPVADNRASYQWQYSTNLQEWTTLPVTLRASTSVSGLTPLTTYYFRFRACTADGEQDWSHPIRLDVT